MLPNSTVFHHRIVLKLAQSDDQKAFVEGLTRFTLEGDGVKF